MTICSFFSYIYLLFNYSGFLENDEADAYRTFDDGFHYYMGGRYNETNFVYVDPHVLGSPTVADVNGDGHIEVIKFI